MNAQLVISAIVRQTTVLIAQIATAQGMRSPLQKVAHQVFLDLVTELEGQGLSKKIVADMFGLALRSNQQKVDRLTESASEGGATLWQVVYDYLRGVETATRSQVLTRFAREDEASVKSILRDLVETGLVYQRGRGEACTYRAAPDADLEHEAPARDLESLAALSWVFVYREGSLKASELAQRLGLDRAALEPVVSGLLRDGRLRVEIDDAVDPTYSTRRCLLPLGDAAGWEASLVDHHLAVVSAVCTKLRNGQTRALPPDQVGGSTYSFDVWPEHPFDARVRALLAETRVRLSELWNQVAEYNTQVLRPDSGVAKVTFYCGQSVVGELEPRDEAHAAEH
jgi:hypothetical protein